MMSKEYRKSTERITPYRLQREKRNAKAERRERPQRETVCAYFGRETIVWCNPGRISLRGAKDEGVRLSLGNRDDSSINYRYGLVHIMEGISHKTSVLIQ